MKTEFLDLTPKSFLCPYCGEWHGWRSFHTLSYYDSERYRTSFSCPEASIYCNNSNYSIFFNHNYCYYSIKDICDQINLSFNGKIPISSIVEDSDNHIVTFTVDFTATSNVGLHDCVECNFRNECILVKLGDNGDHRHMSIPLGFEFEPSDYEQVSKLVQSKSVLNSKQLVKFKKNTKETTTMSNNLFNTEFGPNTDKNIASTIMGIAVNNGSWMIYDKAKRQLTDIGNLKLGSFPIFILPTIKLAEGDLIKDESGEYYYIIKELENGYAETLVAKTGEVKTVMPIKNILGFSCYAKVIAISDSFDMQGSDDDMMKLMLMSSAMGTPTDSSAPNTSMNQLLPLMLFKDKLSCGDGESDDMMKLMLMSSAMGTPTDSSAPNTSMNQLLPLMLFKDKLSCGDGESNDMMKLMLMSMMSGKTESQNPIMSYFMLDTFMKKKEE